jgi:hypothetical protein
MVTLSVIPDRTSPACSGMFALLSESRGVEYIERDLVACTGVSQCGSRGSEGPGLRLLALLLGLIYVASPPGVPDVFLVTVGAVLEVRGAKVDAAEVSVPLSDETTG